MREIFSNLSTLIFDKSEESISMLEISSISGQGNGKVSNGLDSNLPKLGENTKLLQLTIAVPTERAIPLSHDRRIKTRDPMIKRKHVSIGFIRSEMEDSRSVNSVHLSNPLVI